MAVVVLDAGSGDVLASALNPLPNLQSPELMELTRPGKKSAGPSRNRTRSWNDVCNSARLHH